MANPQHIEWLLEGVQSWNKRHEHQGFTPDLEHANIYHEFVERGALGDDGKVPLRGIYLRGANLQSANLSNTDLTGAYLWRANLTDADLENTVLKHARLVGARLDRAKIVESSRRPSLK